MFGVAHLGRRPRAALLPLGTMAAREPARIWVQRRTVWYSLVAIARIEGSRRHGRHRPSSP